MFAPLADSPALLGPKTSAPTAPASPARDTILVVEDEDFVAGLITRFLERGSFRVIRAADGAEAQRLFAQEAPTIALAMVDATLPDMHGGELARSLRDQSSRLPILFVSGRDSTALRDAFAGEAPTGFVAKPFFPAEIVRQVQVLIGATG
jgi:two-component system phosphate regulon response regulator OmpR